MKILKPPSIGDVVVTNYGPCHMRIEMIRNDEYGMHFELVTVGQNTDGSKCWLNNFEMHDGYCRKTSPWLKGSSGFSSNGGGMNGDGYDYISIIERAAQGSLF